MTEFLNRLFRNNRMPKWPPRQLRTEEEQAEDYMDVEEGKVEDLSRDEWRQREVEKLIRGSR